MKTPAQNRQMQVCRLHVADLIDKHPLPMVLDALIEELATAAPDQLHLVEAAGNKLAHAAHMADPKRRAMLDGLRRLEGAVL